VTPDVVERHEMRIEAEDDIILVRRKVRDMAQACKFDIFLAAAVTTAASELARNVYVHGGGGKVVVERLKGAEGWSTNSPIESAPGRGTRIVFVKWSAY
jgi:serine/threonine-protein kinase RsbT